MGAGTEAGTAWETAGGSEADWVPEGRAELHPTRAKEREARVEWEGKGAEGGKGWGGEREVRGRVEKEEEA